MDRAAIGMAGIGIEEATAQLTAKGAEHEIVELEVRGRRLKCWKNVPNTLRELLLTCEQHGDRTFLVYEDERIDFREALQRATALARFLHERLGVVKGDRVALAMRNYPEWPIGLFAAASIGAIVVPLNAWWTGEELGYGISDSGARVLIADAERFERLSPRFDSLPLEHVITVRGGSSSEAAASPRVHAFEKVITTEATRGELPAVAIDPDDYATIFYTSGTTGSPKGALGTHRNMMTNIGSVRFMRARAGLRKGGPPPAPAQPQDVTLVSVPFFHVTGCHSILATAMYEGQRLVLMHRWTPERALELIEREQVNRFGGVPAMAWQVLESPELSRRDTSSVRGVSYGGAPAAPELVRRIEQTFPGSSPTNGYGLTETSAVATMNAGVDYLRKPDSVGPCVPVCEVKVVDSQGRELPDGEVGELLIRGPNVVVGYWNKPDATAETFRDGFLHTGDIVRKDEEGFIHVLDRAKDMLIRGGENIYCVEVENVLYQHPDVMDAAVIGLPHRTLGEEVGAVVQLTAQATVGEAELKAYARERLARFKVPVRIVLWSTPLPRNANGKVLKRALKAELGLA